MKFNIKNFPKTVEGENKDEADIWAEGFEKQLREIKGNLDKLDSPHTVMSVADFQRLINEILGDEK